MTDTDKILIPVWAIKLVGAKGYVDRFLFHASECKTYKAAYLKTEEEYYFFFGVNRYSSYKSFASARRQYRLRQIRNKLKRAEQLRTNKKK